MFLHARTVYVSLPLDPTETSVSVRSGSPHSTFLATPVTRVTYGTRVCCIALMCVTSVALYGGYSLKEGEFTPENAGGKQGHLDWAFFVAIGGAAAAMLAAILIYCDGCRLASKYSSYEPSEVAVS